MLLDAIFILDRSGFFLFDENIRKIHRNFLKRLIGIFYPLEIKFRQFRIERNFAVEAIEIKQPDRNFML